MQLQNSWVGGAGARRRRWTRRTRWRRRWWQHRRDTATVTLASGQKFEGTVVRYDDFVIAIALADGSSRSFRRTGDVPKVEIRDPRDAHIKLLPTYTDKDIHDVTAYLVTLK